MWRCLPFAGTVKVETFSRDKRCKGLGDRYFYSSNCRYLLSKSAASSWRRMMASRAGGWKVLPDGLYPTMITPFLNDEKKSVDWNALDSEF